MGNTRGNFLNTNKGRPVGKQQLYGIAVDTSGNAVLDADGNEQVIELEVVNKRLKVDTSIAGSLANQKTATIAINTALSPSVDLVNSTLVGISMPSAWDTASITLDVSNDGQNFGPLYYGGAEYVILEAVANRRITIDPVALLPWRYIKVRSGINGTTVNQTAERVIALWTKPV